MRKVIVQIAIEGIAKGAKAAIAETKGTLDGLKNVAKGVAIGFAGLNQAAELGGKALNVAKEVYAATVGEALRFREANDLGAIAMRDFERDVLKAKVAMGDSLLPSILGVTGAFSPLIQQGTNWLNKNREMVASGIVNYLADFSRTLIGGVATGLVYASKGATVLGIILDIVRIGANDLGSALLAMVSAALDGAATAAQYLGQEGLAGSLRAASAETKLLQGALDEVAAESASNIDKALAEQSDFERSVIEAEKRVGGFIETARAKGLEAAKQEVKQKKVLLAEEERAAIEHAKMLADLAERARLADVKMQADATKLEIEASELRFQGELEAFQARQAAMDEAKKKAADDDKARTQEIAAFADTAAQGAISLGEELIAAAGAGKEASEVIKEIGTELLIMAAKALALEALKALFKVIGGALFGPVGAAGGGLFGGLLFGSRGLTVPRYATGGVIGGGFSAGDNRLIMARTGEGVVSRPGMNELRRGRIPAEVGGGLATSAAGGGGGNLTVVYQPQTMGHPTTAQNRRFAADTLTPIVRHEQKRGRMR